MYLEAGGGPVIILTSISYGYVLPRLSKTHRLCTEALSFLNEKKIFRNCRKKDCIACPHAQTGIDLVLTCMILQTVMSDLRASASPDEQGTDS